MGKKRGIIFLGLWCLILMFVFSSFSFGAINSNALFAVGSTTNEENGNDDLVIDKVAPFPIIETAGVELKLTEKLERYNEQAVKVTETYLIKNKGRNIGYLFYDTYSFNNGDLYYYLKYEPDSLKSGSVSIKLPFIFEKYDLRTIAYPAGLDQTKSVIKMYANQTSDSKLLEELQPGSVYIDSPHLNAFFSYSSIYEKGSHKIRKELYDKAENIQITSDGVIVTLPAQTNSFSEQWGIISKEKLLDWEDKEAVDAIKIGDLSRVRKWGGDGQYYFLPSGYSPYSPDGFYRNSANHIGNKYLGIEGRMFEAYAYVTIDILTITQNADGFWGTDPMAVGLYNNYKVGAGFFDTRWDTEAALSLLRGYRKYNEPHFLKAAIEFSDFYCEFALSNYYLTTNEGILVYDYGFNAVPGIKTHVSLNHLVNEMNFMYEIFSNTCNMKYLDVAKKILRGISDTAQEWINEETGDLHYGYYGDGKYDVQDYPTLTLNDLLYAQDLIITLYTSEDPAIKMLIDAKMDYLTKAGIAF